MKLSGFLAANGLSIPIAAFIEYAQESKPVIYNWCRLEQYHHRVHNLIRLYKIDMDETDD